MTQFRAINFLLCFLCIFNDVLMDRTFFFMIMTPNFLSMRPGNKTGGSLKAAEARWRQLGVARRNFTVLV